MLPLTTQKTLSTYLEQSCTFAFSINNPVFLEEKTLSPRKAMSLLKKKKKYGVPV
jgi:hypothetical protein